jgi:hypothetical protein
MPDTWKLSAEGTQTFVDKYLDYLADEGRVKGQKGERQLAQTFWRDFFVEVCEVADPLVAGIEFERGVRMRANDTVGWIDCLWPQVVLIEHKSVGSNLDTAETQARDYLISLDPKERPPVIIVSDFERIRIIEVLANRSEEFRLANLVSNLPRIEAMLDLHGRGAGRTSEKANEEAAELMGNLYVEFENAGYRGHEVSVFLVRILFLLFGDDTRLWRQSGDFGLFGSLVEASNFDGSGLGGSIQELFDVLNTPREERPSTLPPLLADFPYANGGLFAEPLRVFSFTRAMRKALFDACAYDWATISPAIFGAMLQDIKSQEARRELGEHYTSEANILKVIGPLFLEELQRRLTSEWDHVSGLRRLHRDLATYNWIDPACGCGNFLVVTYRRIREIELRLLLRLADLEGRAGLALLAEASTVIHLSQFHGIEYEEWSSQIASVALFLSVHQANQEMDRLLGSSLSLLPLRDAATIVHGNALRRDWSEICPINEHTFIMGNPPFAGFHLQNAEQKEDTALVWRGVTGSGVMDYVANWFVLAGHWASEDGCRVGFVATNSISQGQQVAILWNQLLGLGVGIDYAHQTFRWSNDASGEAAVHTVIIGFSKSDKPSRLPLWTYESVDALPQLTGARNINPYLADAPNVLVSSRRRPIVEGVPSLVYGNKPTDDGILSNISSEEAHKIRSSDPIAAQYLRPLIGAAELLNGGDRWCLWLVDASPSDLRASPELSRRIAAVADYRSRSTKAKTRDDAARPSEFQEIRQPRSRFIAVPQHTSERRHYVPVCYFEPEVIVNNAVSIVDDGSLETFGILASRVFRIWADAVSGRLESRLRVSSEVTYNNFPWPRLTAAVRDRIEEAARGVLVVRSHFQDDGDTLADLYHPDAMPHQLRDALRALDVAVLAAIGLRSNATDAAILARLFDLYQELASGMLPTEPAPRRARRRAA